VDARHLLPGLTIAPRLPAAPNALPRMDVALFVGFAAKGPVHRPVMIESPGAFAAVFGPDLTLTPDCTVALGPSVRAFFANGGTRCHVVRTCRTAALEQAWRALRPLRDDEPDGAIAEAGRFVLPGLAALAPDGSRSPAEVRAASLGAWSDRLLVSARIERTAIPLCDPMPSGDGLRLGAATPLVSGELVELRGLDGARAFGVVRTAAGGLAIEALEWISPSASPPAVPERVDRLRLVLRASEGGTSTLLGPFAITPEAPGNWWSLVDDDSFYADPNAVVALRPPLRPIAGKPPVAWLPAGLDGDWSALVGPEPAAATALERDGLARFNAELFLDPRLVDSRGASLVTQAQFARENEGGGLFGIHAALALPGGSDFAEPSLIAVPDLAQPGWVEAPREPLDPPRPAPFPVPDNWRDHSGPCPPPCTVEALVRPDASGFLDCGTRLLAMPEFLPIEATLPGPVLLQWTPSEPGATYVLFEAGRADLTDAVEIWRGEDLQYVADAPRAGAYYFAIRAELDGNVSDTDVTGVQLAVSAWVSDVAHYHEQVLITVHQQLLRLCAALGDQFAVLSLPRHYRAEEAAAHCARLTAGLAFNEMPSLRFGALYHPWLVSAEGPSGDLLELPPDGAAAGVIARRSRERGAWIGPARIPLADIVALADPIADADRDRLAAALVNVVAQEPGGFLMTDAITLSDESDWREINVRRLVSLLRRVAARRGATYVFEPNGDVLRRVIERSFGHMLDELLRRGAFAGKGAGDSYRLMIDATEADRMNGRLVIEIAVAPAQPLRFLTIVLSQVGERLAVVEER
jgi:hypothetical protein